MDGLKLINPAFDFEFAGTVYQVKKATLDKIILFQTKFNELTTVKDPALEKRLAVYSLFLVLKDATPTIPNLTEDWVAANTPDVEMMDVIEEFAFMNRQKVETLRQILQRNAPAQTGEPSSTL